MNKYQNNRFDSGNYPAPHLPPELLCFIIAFAIAGAISQKYALEIGIPLTYLFIKISRYFKERFFGKEKDEV